MDCLFENGAETNFQRKFWKFHHLQLDRKEPDKAPENILSDALMFWQADHLDNFQSPFSIWYSRKAHSFYYKPLVHRGPQWVWAVGREEKKGGRTDMSLGHQHFSGAQPSHAPCPPLLPTPRLSHHAQKRACRHILPSKTIYLTKWLPGRVLALNQRAGRTFKTSLVVHRHPSPLPPPPVTGVPAMPLLWAAR